ncbi:hypothetical protein ACWIGI_37505 [Nocardia sp. NPDC055321]
MIRQTRVLVPESAINALEVIRERRGLRSRNRAIVALLEEYVEVQRVLDPPARLTHVATVIRYPPPRSDRWSRTVGTGRSLALRCDRGLWEAACALAFRLPGQFAFRGHRDYQSRPGTDAVLTAIARVQPLDDRLLGNHQLLTVRQASGLWHLVVEATRTHAERLVTERAADHAHQREREKSTGDRTDAERVADQLVYDVGWLGPHRFTLAREIVLKRLSSTYSRAYLRLLDDDREPRSKVWTEEVEHWNRVATGGDEGDLVQAAHRGATAVWRAERAVRAHDMLAWIRASGKASTPETFVVDPPGWQLRHPREWFASMVTTEKTLTEWHQHIRCGRVLLIDHSAGRFVWPTRAAADESTEPVPGFETVIAHMHAREAREVIEVVLMGGPAHGAIHRSREIDLRVRVPAPVAHDLGLITAAERDTRVEAARRAESDLRPRPGWELPIMNHDIVFDDLEHSYRSGDDRAAARMAYAGGLRSFVKFLRERHHPSVSSHWFSWQSSIPDPWTWDAPSVAAVIADGRLGQDVVRWLLVYRVEQRRRALSVDVEYRWRTAATYSDEPTPVSQAEVHDNARGEPDLPAPF